MDDCEALEAYAQSLEVVQPGDGAFDNPTGLAEATAVGFAATGNLCGNAGGVKRVAIFVVVVSAIALDNGGLGQWPAALAADGRDRFD